MIYLDYAATTPVDKEVLESFNKTCLNYPGNPNSLHRLGVEANHLIESATNQIAQILKVKPNEIIYTSDSSEANNLAIKGIAEKYQNRGKHIITTELEHSSIYGPLGYLQKKGYTVDFVKTKQDGKIDLDHLKELLNEETILVTINAINSEIGIIQPIEEIGKIIKQYPKCFFHIDATQAVTKIDIPVEFVDMFSISAHKFFGINGIGALIKKEHILLEPLIHGGKSTTVFRSGTPVLPLIVAMSKALRITSLKKEEHYQLVSEYNQFLREHLKNYSKVVINSPIDALPYILNISVLGVKPETFLHALEQEEVYISTQSACSSGKNISKAVYAMTKKEEIASSTLRISFAHITTKEELESFLTIFDKCYRQLVNE